MADAPKTTEVLVLASAATALPTSQYRKSIEIQNLGPNAIYVAIGSTACVLNKCRKIGVGESWGIDTPGPVAWYAIASTADQVTGAATIVTEV